MGNFKIQKANITHWTKLSMECYSINSNCSKCEFIPQRFKTICKVKYYVPYLYNIFGEPKEKGRKNHNE